MNADTTTPPSAEPKKAPWLPPRWFVRTAWVLHRRAYAVSGGRLGLRSATADRAGYFRLHTVGRRSGHERQCILGYLEDGSNLVTLAMNGWGEAEPAWWLNLQAHPEATVDLSDGSRAVVARAATTEERSRLWTRFSSSLWGDLDSFAARRPRETAIVILEPRLPSR